MAVISEKDISGSIACHNIPEAIGVYIITDENNEVLYVGYSSSLRRRIAYMEAHVFDARSNKYTHSAADQLIKLQSKGKKAITHYMICESEKEAKKKEQELIDKYKPIWNSKQNRDESDIKERISIFGIISDGQVTDDDIDEARKSLCKITESL